MTKKKAKKKVAKKKATKKKVTYKYIEKEGDDIYLKARVYNKMMTNHSGDLLLKKDKELANMKKQILEHEKNNIIEQYKKAIDDTITLIENIDNKLEQRKEEHKKQLKQIQTELGDENQAFSIVDEDTYKILLET